MEFIVEVRKMVEMSALAEAVTKGDQNGAVEMTKTALAEGVEGKP